MCGSAASAWEGDGYGDPPASALGRYRHRSTRARSRRDDRLAIVAWQTARSPLQTPICTALGLVFAPLLPPLHLLRQVLLGTVTDRHVRQREQRPRILLIALASGLVGLLLMAVLGAPPGLIALLAAGAAALVVPLLITLRWKISVHVGAIAGIIAVCAIWLGPPAVLLAPLVLLVAWARVEMGAHTVGQVSADRSFGAATSGGTFYVLMRFIGQNRRVSVVSPLCIHFEITGQDIQRCTGVATLSPTRSVHGEK